MNGIEDALREGGRAGVREPAARAARGLAARAGAEGLVDVAYSVVDSPLGPLMAAATERGLIALSYDAGDGLLERIAAGLSPRILEAPARLDGVRRELDEYFEGRRRDFATPVDWALVDGYARRVLQATARIPYGQVRSYAQIAAAAGSPRGHRAAGNALGGNMVPVVVPCHRVVRSGGAIGGYGGGVERKRYLLSLEADGADASEPPR